VAETVIWMLERLLARKGTTKKAVAKRLGRSRQWLDSALDGGPVGAAVCMRLARQGGVSRVDLLRSAGHDDVADELIAAELDITTPITVDERMLLAAYHALTDDQQQHFLALIQCIAGAVSRPNENVGTHKGRSKRRTK
jgi:hypothetical protein